MSIPCSCRLVSVLMTRAGIGGLPGPARIKRLRGVATADDLVHGKFHRLTLNELWVTDITGHPTREGKIYRAAVLDACGRKIIGWAIDSKQDSTLVVNALDMAIRARQPGPGGVVHADHGVQFTSWGFTQKIRSASLLPSFGTVGDGLDNAMMESCWSTMQIELLNRKKWKTRIELANAIFEYIEVFYNRRRRHSSLEYATPHHTTTTSPQGHSPPPKTSDREWKPSHRSGQGVTDSCSRPLPEVVWDGLGECADRGVRGMSYDLGMTNDGSPYVMSVPQAAAMRSVTASLGIELNDSISKAIQEIAGLPGVSASMKRVAELASVSPYATLDVSPVKAAIERLAQSIELSNAVRSDAIASIVQAMAIPAPVMTAMRGYMGIDNELMFKVVESTRSSSAYVQRINGLSATSAVIAAISEDSEAEYDLAAELSDPMLTREDKVAIVVFVTALFSSLAVLACVLWPEFMLIASTVSPPATYVAMTSSKLVGLSPAAHP